MLFYNIKFIQKFCISSFRAFSTGRTDNECTLTRSTQREIVSCRSLGIGLQKFQWNTLIVNTNKSDVIDYYPN